MGVTTTVDHAALRTNQACIIGLLVVAFVADLVPLVATVGLIMAIGTVWPRAGLFKLFYVFVLKGRILQPDVIGDNPQPHRFSQGFGAVVLGVALSLFAVGWTIAAWLVVGVVVALAALNLFLGFCAGCFLYYRLARAEVSGFTALPIGDGPLGMRPR